VRKYGLPLSVVAGLVLAAALGAVAGARWARPGSGARAGDGLTASAEPAAADLGGSRRTAPPRFLVAGEPVAEGAAAVQQHHRRRAGLVARAPEAAPGPTGPRPEASAEGSPPSPAAIARAREVRATLESAVAAHPGTRVRFADCSTGTCVARVESAEAAPIDRLIADRQHLPPGFTVRAHERLTAFNGRIWELDLVEERAPP
jgi:hypothetical protein